MITVIGLFSFNLYPVELQSQFSLLFTLYICVCSTVLNWDIQRACFCRILFVTSSNQLHNWYPMGQYISSHGFMLIIIVIILLLISIV